MTIRKLKEMIADLPDDMRVYADDGTDFFKGNSEFLCISASEEFSMAVFQTRNDFEPVEETEAMLGWSFMTVVINQKISPILNGQEIRWKTMD